MPLHSPISQRPATHIYNYPLASSLIKACTDADEDKPTSLMLEEDLPS